MLPDKLYREMLMAQAETTEESKTQIDDEAHDQVRAQAADLVEQARVSI